MWGTGYSGDFTEGNGGVSVSSKMKRKRKLDKKNRKQGRKR